MSSLPAHAPDWPRLARSAVGQNLSRHRGRRSRFGPFGLSVARLVVDPPYLGGAATQGTKVLQTAAKGPYARRMAHPIMSEGSL